jgi:hypothetical protein
MDRLGTETTEPTALERVLGLGPIEPPVSCAPALPVHVEVFAETIVAQPLRRGTKPPRERVTSSPKRRRPEGDLHAGLRAFCIIR